MCLFSKDCSVKIPKKGAYAWAGLLITMLMIRLGIDAAIPDISTWLSILIFLPPVFYTIYIQLEILSKKGLISLPQLNQVR